MPLPDIPRAEEWMALLEARLPQKNIHHCLSVANYAAYAADRSGVDRIEAATAGMLHDIHKATPKRRLVELAEAWDIPITEVQRQKPKLLHAPVAAEECRRELGITSDAIYEAIWWHTTGTPEMGPVAMVLYLADFSEPLRIHPEAPHARDIFENKGLWPALRYVAQSKLRYATLKPPVDPNTWAFSEWLNNAEPAARAE